MSWLPRLSVHDWTTCTDRYEAEGRSLMVEWRSLVIEICIGKREREFQRDIEGAPFADEDERFTGGGKGPPHANDPDAEVSDDDRSGLLTLLEEIEEAADAR